MNLQNLSSTKLQHSRSYYNNFLFWIKRDDDERRAGWRTAAFEFDMWKGTELGMKLHWNGKRDDCNIK